MNYRSAFFAGILASLISLTACKKEDTGFTGLHTQKDSVSYSIGVDLASKFKEMGWELDEKVFFTGFEIARSGETPAITPEQAQTIIINYQREMTQAVQDKEGAQNKAKGDQFLAENKDKPGIKTLPSGLQYEVLSEGSGASPTLDDKVKIHYRGTLLDGTTFDSSYERGEPAVFQPRGLIKAWQEILPLMKPGSKYKIFSPSELAYGAFGSPPRIGPNETLIFEMELFEVIKE